MWCTYCLSVRFWFIRVITTSVLLLLQSPEKVKLDRDSLGSIAVTYTGGLFCTDLVFTFSCTLRTPAMWRSFSHWQTGLRVVWHGVLWLTAALCNHITDSAKEPHPQSFIKIALVKDVKSCGRNAYSSPVPERTRPTVKVILDDCLMVVLLGLFGREPFKTSDSNE